MQQLRRRLSRTASQDSEDDDAGYDTFLSRVNEVFAKIPTRGIYELNLVVGGHAFRISSSDTQHLNVTLKKDEDPIAQTVMTVDCAETLQKLGSGDQGLAMKLLAQRKLRMTGDMTKLEELKCEMVPHSDLFKELLSGTSPWVPNSAAQYCMNSTCGKTFTILRRRHHCRGCGQIFCRHCAPKMGGRRTRTCFDCMGKNYVSRAQAGDHSPVSRDIPSPAPIVNASEGESEIEKWAIVYELQVEQTIYQTNLLCYALMCLGIALLAYMYSHLLHLLQTFPICFSLAGATSLLYRRSLLRILSITKISWVITLQVLHTYIRAHGRSAMASEALWRLTHQVNARMLFDATVSLSGFWIKIAQGLSVSPVLPDAYKIELTKLQDAVPPCSREEVERTLQEEFGQQWQKRIILHDGPPLGSATIAQVHRAKIRESPEHPFIEGVVKIQRPGIKQTLTLDTHAAGVLAHGLKLCNRKMFKDFPSIFREVAKLTLAELDFRTEAENQRMARSALGELDSIVMVPKVFGDIVSQRAFAMEFVDGEKITDYVKNGGNAQKIVETVCKYFAHSVMGPIFNTDPHPGNLFVEKASGRLCVLDWGQALRQTPGERDGMASLWIATALASPAAFIEACNIMGYSFDKRSADYGSATFALNGFRWNSRETKSLKETKGDTAEFMKFVQGMPEEIADLSAGAGAFWKGPLLSFGKTLELVFNVSTQMEVSVSCLAVCALQAYRHVLHQKGYQLSPTIAADTFFILPSKVLLNGSSSPGRTLDADLRVILERQHSQGTILGAQLVVLDAQSGETVCNACIGHTSWLDPKPVTPATIFDIGEVSKLVLTLIIMRLVESKKLSLEHPLARLCPAVEHLKDVTLEQILSHKAGVFQIYPKCAQTIADAQDIDKMLSGIIKEVPLMAAGEIQTYHHTSFGLLLTNILQLIGIKWEDCWNELKEIVFGSRGSSLLLSCDETSSDVAAVQGNLRAFGFEEMAKDFEALQEIMEYAKARKKLENSPSKAEAVANMATMGRENWHVDGGLSFPGCKAFGTAHDLAQILLKTHQGKIVQKSTLENLTRSRKPAGDASIKFPKDFSVYNGSEFGLGMQLLRSPGETRGHSAWGHMALTGSFAFAVPGQRPLVAGLTLNRIGGQVVAEEILSCLWRHAT